MAVVGQGFKVVTEFVFNADQAVNGAELLNRQVQKLSDSADQAISSVANLGIRYAMSFSGATGGILGVLGNAIKSSDKFKSTQIELANAMQANKMKMNGGVLSFNDALTQSGFIMDGVIAKSRKLGISPDQFTSQVKFFNNMLAPKGLAGENLGQAQELARVSMKSAPALGVSNDQAISGIMSGISGQLSKNTQFGTRLFMESGDAIKKETGIGGLKDFNKASPEKRIKALIVGLDKLAGSAETITARADTLGARLDSIRDLFWGVGSVLKPLGDVILPLIKDTLDIVIKYIKTDGVKIINEMAKFVKSFMKGPKELLAQLMQLKELSSDLGTAISIGSFGLLIAHTKELFGFLGGNKYTRGIANAGGAISGFIEKIPLIGTMFKSITSSMASMFHINMSGGFLTAVKSIGMALTRMAGFIGILLIPLQGLSQAINRIKTEDMANLVGVIPAVMENLNKLQMSLRRFMSPITDMIDGWGELFYSLIRMLPFMGKGSNGLAGTINNVSDSVESLSLGFLALWGTLKGMVAGISAMVGSMSTGNFSDLDGTFMDAMDNEFAKTMDAFRAPTLQNGKEGVVSNTVTTNHIKMTNNFKETLQPDRIAFTIKKQLEKESANRRSAGPTGIAGKTAMGT